MDDTYEPVTSVKDGKIKGTGLIGIVRALRAEREQALHFLPEHLQHYLDQRIAITAWYPEADFVALMDAHLRIQKGLTWEQAGVLAAQEALAGVYRNTIVEGDLAETAQRVRVNWRNYHDTGTLSVDILPSLVRITVEGYCIVSSRVCRLNQGYFGTLLSLAGVQITEERKVCCTARSDDVCTWEYAWKADSGPAR